MSKLKNLVNSGHATHLELLETTFGSWPPKGLDIITPPIGTVYIDKLYKFYIRDTINKLNFNPKTILTKTTKAKELYESVHGLFDYKTNTIFSKNEYIYDVGLLMHEHIHALQNIFSSSDVYHIDHSILPKEALDYIEENKNKLFKGFKSDTITYLSNFAEIQSHLMSTLASGYRMGWECMPTTRLELWAALHNFGISLPADLHQELVTDTMKWQDALARFPVELEEAGNHNPDRLGLRNLLQAFPGAAQPIFEQVFPALYGVGLTYIGDRYGIQRMERSAVDNSLRDQIAEVMLPYKNLDDIELAKKLNVYRVELDPDTPSTSSKIQFVGHQFLNKIGKHLYNHPLLDHDFKIITKEHQVFWKPYLSVLHDAGFTDAPASQAAHSKVGIYNLLTRTFGEQNSPAPSMKEISNAFEKALAAKADLDAADRVYKTANNNEPTSKESSAAIGYLLAEATLVFDKHKLPERVRAAAGTAKALGPEVSNTYWSHILHSRRSLGNTEMIADVLFANETAKPVSVISPRPYSVLCSLPRRKGPS